MVVGQLAFCVPYQLIHKKPKSPSLKLIEILKKMWQTGYMDYFGPLPNEKYALVMIDERSRYPVVVFTDSTSVKHLKAVFEMTFLHFGCPEKLVSNRGSPFGSEEIKHYMLKHAIKHSHVTPS